jgi:hypothetical protein
MWQNILDFFGFWLGCAGSGFELGDGLVWKIEGLLTIVVPVFKYAVDATIKFVKWLRRPKGEIVSTEPKEHSSRLEKWWHDFENKITKFSVGAGVAMFLFITILVAPFSQNKEQKEKSKNDVLAETEKVERLQKEINDKSPKLNGFIHRSLITDEPGTTNSLIFIEATIDNTGGSPSYADSYGVKVMLSNGVTTNAGEIDFADEYKLNIMCEGNPYLLDLKRPQLISEKTTTAITPGNFKAGWTAFRLKGIPGNRYDQTNIVFTFLDFNRKRTYVTNNSGQFLPCAEGLAKVTPGSDNIVSPIELPPRTNNGEWLPPTLASGCSNVTIFLGGLGFVEPRLLAEVGDSGTKFLVKDLPDFMIQDWDKLPGYSPRQKYLWFKSAGSIMNIGGKTISFPVRPVVISNRLYVEVEIPFSNEKHKLVMSDAFDSDLSPLPLNWDWNYSTNYDANGNGVFVYEIVNELTNPVLQVAYTAPNEIHVDGIFQVDSNSILATFGEQPMLATFKWGTYDATNGTTVASLQIENFHESVMLHSNETLASIGQRFTNEFFRPIFKYQRPIFKYPSSRHLGDFEEWVKEDHKRDTNIVDKK